METTSGVPVQVTVNPCSSLFKSKISFHTNRLGKLNFACFFSCDRLQSSSLSVQGLLMN